MGLSVLGKPAFCANPLHSQGGWEQPGMMMGGACLQRQCTSESHRCSILIWKRDRGTVRSRELAEAAGPGSGLVASTVLALGLAWSNVEAPEAQAGFELPYKAGTPEPESLNPEHTTSEGAL